MAEWATKHRTERSPALGRSRIVLVRRPLVTALLGLALLGALAVTARPASAAPPAILPSRDVNDPGISGQRDGEVTVTGTGASRAPATTGKTAGIGEIQRQGSVVAVFEDPADPLIVIAVENGYVTVRLRCGSLCPSIRLGDYVVVEGQRRSEAVVDAVDVWVATP